MTAPDTTTVRPPHGGRTARHRPVRRLVAGVLISASTALLAAPAAGAATAPTTPASSLNRVVLADPAPSPGPVSTNPGIGLGPGAPVGTPTAPTPVTTTDPGTGGSTDPSWYDIPGQIQKAIDDWFGSIVADALTPMLNLLGSTLLGTPDVTTMPRVESLWTQMAFLANAFYILLVLAGAVIVMTHGTVQSRNSAKEIVPRLFVGMIAGNASIALLALMIHLADALASAILGGTINPSTAGQALGNMLGATGGNGIFLILLDLGAEVMLIAILLTYIVRVAVTVVLAVAAPLALSLHALPQTEHLAKLWWRAFTGVFLIQLGQSLVFVVALDVMLDPTAAVSIFGLPNGSALVDTLVFLALCWILIKIPSWVSRSIFGAGSSKMMRLAKAVVAYKTFGALGLKRGPGGIPVKKASPPNRPRPPAGGSWGGPRPGGPGPTGPGPGPGGSGSVIYTVTQVDPDPPVRTGIGRSRPVLVATKQAPAGQGPRLAIGPGAGIASPPAGDGAGASGRRIRGQQVPLPIPGSRRAMEAAATSHDYHLARNALHRPQTPGTWREEREAMRRPGPPAAGPRHRQEGLFPRNPARMNPPAPVPTPSSPAPAKAPAPAPRITVSAPPRPTPPAAAPGSSPPPSPARPVLAVAPGPSPRATDLTPTPQPAATKLAAPARPAPPTNPASPARPVPTTKPATPARPVPAQPRRTNP